MRCNLRKHMQMKNTSKLRKHHLWFNSTNFANARNANTNTMENVLQMLTQRTQWKCFKGMN